MSLYLSHCCIFEYFHPSHLFLHFLLSRPASLMSPYSLLSHLSQSILPFHLIQHVHFYLTSPLNHPPLP